VKSYFIPVTGIEAASVVTVGQGITPVPIKFSDVKVTPTNATQKPIKLGSSVPGDISFGATTVSDNLPTVALNKVDYANGVFTPVAASTIGTYSATIDVTIEGGNGRVGDGKVTKPVTFTVVVTE